MKKMLFLFAAAASLFSCTKNEDKSGVFKGPETTVYDGKAWSSVRLAKDGTPQQVILSLSNTALNSVVTGSDAPDEGPENTFLVNLHPKAASYTPFTFIMLDWNPHGHEPAGVYDRPHFDMHFYMTPSSEVLNYTDMAKLNHDPAPDYLPLNHVPGAPVPLMGKHWVDITSPEFHGLPFTQTFIYGSYDGDVVFYEPMITLDFLKSTSAFERPIPQPARFKKAGYYPTKMIVVKHDSVTDIILDGFVYRQAS
ncbi:MAG: hypothetical protein ACXVMS_03560 [Flavisolibacter sp.]